MNKIVIRNPNRIIILHNKKDREKKMAETTVDNGVPPAEEEELADSFFDPDQVKLESLERENKEMKERITTLTIEVDGSEEDKKLFDSIAARAVELETEVARLQHDLITAIGEGEEATHEVAELKKAIAEKGEKLDSVEKEVDALKKEKAESEKKVRELERKVGLLEVKEIEEKSKKLRVEEEMREKIDEKDREIIVFKRRVDELVSELDKWKFEKKSVEETLILSEKKSKEMEFLILQLQREAEEAQKVITGLKEKTLDGFNGTDRDVQLSVGAQDTGFNWQLPAVAVAAAAASAGVVYACYARRR
ncbi:hypothetical protein LWI29_034032 [Acer saccharum]|uniref:Peroxisomal and mitochondrial division factor 2-like n=1 Tax=Acer saccharum TaxID=4024 RepID=A0AA39SJR0_ACESA|nr:hypothetical protein LWI29_034032 [Acer saccharum]